MKQIEDELRKYRLSYNDKVSLEQIVEVLDNFQQDKFNRLLFFHIVEYAKLNRNPTISL